MIPTLSELHYYNKAIMEKSAVVSSYKLKSAKYNGNSKLGVFNCLRQATGECHREIKNKQNIIAAQNLV